MVNGRIGYKTAISMLTILMLFAGGCGKAEQGNGPAESVPAEETASSAAVSPHVSADESRDSTVSEDVSDASSIVSADASTDTSSDTSTDALPETSMNVNVSENTFSGTSNVIDESLVTDADTLQIILDTVEEAKERCVVEYADFTAEEFLSEVASVYHMAHGGGYLYGNSQTMPPCEDGYISCDRLIARALWNLGMTDQEAYGMNVGNEVEYLTTHGFELVTDQSKLVSGDIVMQDNGVSGQPNWRWHTFVLVSYDPETTMCEKYDCGHFTPEGEDRISSEQPFRCYLADYGAERRFVCGFHLKEKPIEAE